MGGFRTMLESAGHDFIVSLRSLRNSPVFALAAIGSLALGLGANIAIFSFVNAVLLTDLPVPQPERLVAMDSVMTIRALDELDVSGVFDGLFGSFRTTSNLVANSMPASGRARSRRSW